MNINEQLHKIQMEKHNQREKVMLHIKLIYKKVKLIVTLILSFTKIKFITLRY